MPRKFVDSSSNAPENHYDADYFAHFSDSSRRSAEIIVRIVATQLINGPPSSVLDLGCGIGAWLAAWKSIGATVVHGVDGQWVQKNQLQISPECFESFDLSRAYQPTQRFDIAMSVEAAEHLPETAADGVVNALADAAPVVLFSASIPGQLGENHINCQWPTYWARKFRDRGYQCYDSIRPLVWTDDRVGWWYRQNIMLYARDTSLLRTSIGACEPLPLVHPEMFAYMRDWGMEQQRLRWGDR